jgi:hypothetical protein
MTPPTVHVSEDELILHFYGESHDEAPVERHLASCGSCRDAFERLRQVLSMMDGADALGPAEAPGPAFERDMWARLEPQLAGARRSWLSRWWSPDTTRVRMLALAGGVAVLLLVAFVAGRLSRDVAPPTQSADAAANVAERVLVVAVVDHLDRSQMVLLEVMNSDVENAGQLAAERSLARELVTANRLYRQTAAQTGDDGTGDVLDELERVLLEIANTPGDASKADLDALRARIVSHGLLFKVRVVHSEMVERERQTVLPGSQS